MTQSFPYWQKQTKPLYSDLLWNLPEQKSGKISVIGGNAQNFSTEIRISEFISKLARLENVTTVLPDSLKSTLPPLPNLVFTPSTDSGTFKKSAELGSALASSDFSVFLGDFSKNAETSIAISDVVKNLEIPFLLTRDTIDLIASDAPNFIEKSNLFIVAPAIQIQKLFRSVFYPKVILLSMPLLQFIEALHKFTLSYPLTILTFHEGQIIVAHDGKIVTTPIEITNYSPLSLWSGELAAKIAILNHFNPSDPLKATAAAILWQ